MAASRWTLLLAACWLAVAGLACSHFGEPRAGDDAGAPPSLDAFPVFDGGDAGYALQFDGVNDYATCATAAFPAAGSTQTISMWVNYASGATTQDFLVMRLDFISGVQIGLHGGTVAVWRTYVDRAVVQAPTLPPANQWHHVAYTYDGTTHNLYIDGVVVDTETVPGDIRTPTSGWLGSIDGNNELYKGQLDEIRIWNVVRTAAQVQMDMHHSPPGTEPGLVAYWTFDDAGSGGRALDASGLDNDVTLGDGIAERMPSRVRSTAPIGP
jgi:Concanavalin A-like lectin/glucanases superfamily